MNRDIVGILYEVLNIVKKFKMAAVSKQEYLKRYLSNADSGEKKKRKKKVKVGVKTGKSLIIDDDVNLRDIKVRQDSETGENLLDLADETPLIFNETGTTVLSKDLESIKKKEDEKKAMWAPVKTFQDEIPAEKRDQNAKDLSPRRSRVRHDSSSPERNSIKEKLGHSEDLSPRLRTRHDSASDQSPPRRTRHDSSSDQSPPRNKPTATQQRKTRHDSVDLSPPRRGNKRLTSPDQSPPRRHKHDSSSDQYPPRIARPSANRPKRTRHDSPDLSPPRKTRGSPPDQSPSRRQSAKRAFKGENDNDQSPPRKQKSSERKAGLHSAAELRQENEKTRQRENEMFARMHANATGRGAETVHRDKSGRKRDFKVEEAKKKEDERKKEEENEKFMEWGKGVKQSKSEKDRVQDDLYEMSKPLARYKNDADLDQMLKERERAEDPMLAFMQKKKAKQNVIAGKKEKPKYKGPAPPPNRFNIPPGYRWDGVDRSNGFEKKRFSMLANKGATREEAYKWSTEDM